MSILGGVSRLVLLALVSSSGCRGERPVAIAPEASPSTVRHVGETRPFAWSEASPLDEEVELGALVEFDAELVTLCPPLDEVRVFFAFDSVWIPPPYRERLAVLADCMRDVEDLRLNITGSADAAGPADDNYALGLARARAVASYLEDEGGIDPARLSTGSIGETFSSPHDEQPAAYERRVYVYADRSLPLPAGPE